MFLPRVGDTASICASAYWSQSLPSNRLNQRSDVVGTRAHPLRGIAACVTTTNSCCANQDSSHSSDSVELTEPTTSRYFDRPSSGAVPHAARTRIGASSPPAFENDSTKLPRFGIDKAVSDHTGPTTRLATPTTSKSRFFDRLSSDTAPCAATKPPCFDTQTSARMCGDPGLLEAFDENKGWLWSSLVPGVDQRIYVPPTQLLQVYDEPQPDGPFSRGLPERNAFDPPWKTLIDTKLCFDSARSSRIACDTCDLKINKGMAKVGIQHVYYQTNARCAKAISWFHMGCFPAAASCIPQSFIRFAEGFENMGKADQANFENALSAARSKWNTSQPIELVNPVSEPLLRQKPLSHVNFETSLADFAVAGRNAIGNQIRDFKQQHFEEDTFSDTVMKCPVSEKLLTPADAHVHHQYPLQFHDIVTNYIAELELDISTIRLRGSEFARMSDRKSFADYHKRVARLLVVHKKANLSDLKRNFNQGVCDRCKHVSNELQNHKECNLVLCYDCSFATFLCTEECLKEFGLKYPDLDQLRCIRRPNRLSKNFSDMRLFLATDVYSLAVKKVGKSAVLDRMRSRPQKKREKQQKMVQLLMKADDYAATRLRTTCRTSKADEYAKHGTTPTGKRKTMILSSGDRKGERVDKDEYFESRKKARRQHIFDDFAAAEEPFACPGRTPVWMPAVQG